MWLMSNIFITRAIDCIDIYTHLGGDAAAWVSHAKDAAGVRILNKIDTDGIHLLGHTVVDWGGERWVCQTMLPGIFSRRIGDDEEAALASEAEAEAQKAGASKEDGEKEDWVKVQDSPAKPAKTNGDTENTMDAVKEEEELPENPLIIYGVDSERSSVLHWDAATHKVMSKLASVFKLAEHKVTDGKDIKHDFFASSEVKALRGTDGRRYLLDLPRLMPVDIEWLEKDYDGKLAGPEKDVQGSKYPHRMTLLRPELVEQFWDNELKAWLRNYAAHNKAKVDAEKTGIDEQTNGDTPVENGTTPSDGESAPTSDSLVAKSAEIPAVAEAEAAAAHKAETEKPIDPAMIEESIKDFDLRFNPDAFVDQAPKKGSDDMSAYIPSPFTDESDPTIKAVRDASKYLREIAIPAVTLDIVLANVTVVMDGASLSKQLHQRGINIRYLGYIAASATTFANGQTADGRIGTGHLGVFLKIVETEMIFRAGKHILRSLIRGLAAEHVSCAVSHFLNCLIGASISAAPKAVYNSLGLSDDVEPAYTRLTPESLRKQLIAEVEQRFRWRLDEKSLTEGLRKRHLLREFAERFAFQVLQRDYVFESEQDRPEGAPEEDEKPKEGKKDKKDKKGKAVIQARSTTFEPSDILTMIPIVRSTAPNVSRNF
jgi:protein TIF31